MRKSIMAVPIVAMAMLVGCGHDKVQKSETIVDETILISAKDSTFNPDCWDDCPGGIDNMTGSDNRVSVVVTVQQNGPLDVRKWYWEDRGGDATGFYKYTLGSNIYSATYHFPMEYNGNIGLVNNQGTSCKVYWQVIHTWWE